MSRPRDGVDVAFGIIVCLLMAALLVATVACLGAVVWLCIEVWSAVVS